MANEDDARSVILSMEQEPSPQRRCQEREGLEVNRHLYGGPSTKGQYAARCL
jgi:hypothetical protein